MSPPEVRNTAENSAPVPTTVGSDRRQSARRDCELCIIAVPVDESGDEIGPCVAGHCLNVSSGGIRITLANEVEAELMRIEPIVDEVELGFSSAIFKVVRQSSEYWCSTYAGPFVDSPRTPESEQAGGASSLWPLGAPGA